MLYTQTRYTQNVYNLFIIQDKPYPQRVLADEATGKPL